MNIEDFFTKINSPIQQIKEDFLEEKNIKLYIKRDDLLSNLISGNKFRKLKYNLIEAKNQGFTKLVTFAGAYSNHLYAFAAAGKIFGFETTCFVRGEELNAEDNQTLSFAKSQGVDLFFVSRASYREKEKLLQSLDFNYYHVPEGGTNDLAIKGVSEMCLEFTKEIKPDIVCVSVGTGGTMAGLLNGVESHVKVVGFSSFAQNNEVKDLLNCKIKNRNFEITNEFKMGGYGKTKPELLDFMGRFYSKHQIMLDQVYTAKMFFGLYELIGRGEIEQGSTILAIHTGGLQGNKK